MERIFSVSVLPLVIQREYSQSRNTFDNVCVGWALVAGGACARDAGDAAGVLGEPLALLRDGWRTQGAQETQAWA